MIQKSSIRSQNKQGEAASPQSSVVPDGTFIDAFVRQAAAHPAKEAVVAYAGDRSERSSLTYEKLSQLVDAFAAGLIQLGVKAGDVVSIQLPNCCEAPVAVLGTLRAGAVPNALPPLFRRRELSFMLAHARTRVLVVPSTFRGFSHAELGLSVAAEVDTLEHVVVVGDSVPEHAISFVELLEPLRGSSDAASELDRRRPKPDDVSLLLYTSGTTGIPKGVVHSHASLWSAGRGIPEAVGLTEDDVGFMPSTIGHLAGFLWGLLWPLAGGQTTVYQDAWRPDPALAILESERVTWTLSATPFVLDLIAAQRREHRELESFRAFVCGGAPIPAAVAGEAKEVLDVDLISLWGMTEVGVCTIHSLGSPLEVLSASDGVPVDHMDVRIVDSDLNAVPAGAEGRLQVRGPSVCVSYLRQPDFYADALTEDGWFDTGDLGREVAGGIRISGRSKDIIIRGGENVPVAEIESALFSHPRVCDVAVIGYADPRLGERVCAVIVPTETGLTLKELTDYLDGIGMAKQYWPQRLELVGDMPRTPAGKIQKFVLKERLLAADQKATHR